jgi:hypothetical protein
MAELDFRRISRFPSQDEVELVSRDDSIERTAGFAEAGVPKRKMRFLDA